MKRIRTHTLFWSSPGRKGKRRSLRELSGSRVVDRTSPLDVELEHGRPLVSQATAFDRDPAVLEVAIRVGENRPLIEPGACRVLTRCRKHHAGHTAPERGAEAHRARL